MPAERFFDTNILLYGYDLDSPVKRAIAQALIGHAWSNPGSTAISVQVLLEFHVNFVRSGHTAAAAAQIIDYFCAWPVMDNTLALFRLGLSVQKQWRLSLWDSMIVAAAQMSGAQELYTEDLNHGQNYGGVLVINPFV